MYACTHPSKRLKGGGLLAKAGGSCHGTVAGSTDGCSRSRLPGSRAMCTAMPCRGASIDRATPACLPACLAQPWLGPSLSLSLLLAAHTGAHAVVTLAALLPALCNGADAEKSGPTQCLCRCCTCVCVCAFPAAPPPHLEWEGARAAKESTTDCFLCVCLHADGHNGHDGCDGCWLVC